jgi:hypothetical protein
MYLGGERAPAFQAFLKANRAFWARERVGADGRPLYVDIAHDNPAYLLTNLWLAKYLQRFLGGHLVGVAHRPRDIPTHSDLAAARQLASSFGIDSVIDLDAASDVHRSKAEGDGATLRRALEADDGTSLGNRLIRFGLDDDPDCGSLLYDSWLQRHQLGTLAEVPADFYAYAVEALALRRGVRDLFRDGPGVACLLGHHQYTPYGFIARETVRQGGTYYFQSLLTPHCLRRFRNGDEIRAGRSTDLLDVLSRPASDEALDRFASRMFEVQATTRQFFRPMQQNGIQGTRADTLPCLGLDPSHPVACFYAPALCGPSHSFGPNWFDDNGDWLRRSLRIAVRHPEVGFIVKRHPQDSVYDRLKVIDRLRDEFGHHGNIGFLEAEFSGEQMAALCDLVVTVSGTPGYELAIRGVPTVATGPSRYSGLGFALEPSTEDEYEAVLAKAGSWSLTDAQRRAALSFAFFELVGGRARSIFVPPALESGSAGFWTTATANVRSGWVEEDPVYRSVKRMIELDLPFTPNTAFVQP